MGSGSVNHEAELRSTRPECLRPMQPAATDEAGLIAYNLVAIHDQLERIADRLDSWSYQQSPQHQTLLRVGEGA